MSRLFQLFVAGAAFSLLVLASSSSPAQGYGANCGGLGWYGAPYRFYQDEHIPYYALHPPVYYSLPVPRTYGYSPFAYPPGTMTPEIIEEKPAPANIINPYVPQKPEPKKTSLEKSVKVEPKMIYNPFAQPAQLSDRR